MTEMTTALDGLDNMATACHMKFLSFFSDKHRKVWNDEVCDIVVSNEANEYFDKIRDIVRCHGGFKSTVIDGELHILGVGISAMSMERLKTSSSLGWKHVCAI